MISISLCPASMPLRLTLLLLMTTLSGLTPVAVAQSDYNKALCISNAKREETCSVTLTSKSILLKYATGRNESIKRSKILEVTSKDESTRKGFIFTRVERRYLYSVNFLNVDNDPERISIAFDDFALSKEFESLLSAPR
jgi:hypothetical protein